MYASEFMEREGLGLSRTRIGLFTPQRWLTTRLTLSTRSSGLSFRAYFSLQNITLMLPTLIDLILQHMSVYARQISQDKFILDQENGQWAPWTSSPGSLPHKL